jgi:hypothetical protein
MSVARRTLKIRDAEFPAKGGGAMKNDKVEIVIDAGGGTRTYEVVATRAGRRVEITQGRGVVEVTEVTRGGTPVRTARFMSARVLALVEHPAPRPAAPDDEEITRLHRTA